VTQNGERLLFAATPISEHPQGYSEPKTSAGISQSRVPPYVVTLQKHQEEKKLASKYFCFNRLELKILDIALTALKRTRRLHSYVYNENENECKSALDKLIKEVRTEYGADFVNHHFKPCTGCGGKQIKPYDDEKPIG